jgi:hypothetical protein
MQRIIDEMARYIDADKMQEFIEEQNDINDWLVSQYNADWISSFIDNQPTADVVEVKHGYWMDYPSDTYMKCSVCGREYLKSQMPKIVGYCPNPECGARMNGEW